MAENVASHSVSFVTHAGGRSAPVSSFPMLSLPVSFRSWAASSGLVGAVGMAAMCLTGSELAAWVNESCARQGVPAKVTDFGVVSRVAVLLAVPVHPGARGASAPTQPGPAERSEPPDEFDSGRVQRAGAGGAGADHAVIDDRSDDGGLAGEVEARPLSA